LKKIGYIILFALILLQAGGLLLVYKIQQCYVQHQMAELIERSEGDFLELKLSPGEYEKNKSGADEICYKGKMYDIKAVVVGQNTVNLQVVNDAKEESVLKKIKALTENKEEDKELIEQLLKLFAHAYISPSSDTCVFFAETVQSHFYCYKDNLMSLPGTIVYPPPRVS
jgi:chorismate mutase